MPAPPQKQAGMEMYEVKRGDTLSKIALKYKPDDVSLEQMLVALFRDNPEAFAGKNMNRLKTGPLMSIPNPSEAAAVDAKASEARSAAPDGELERLQGTSGGCGRHGSAHAGRGRTGCRRQSSPDRSRIGVPPAQAQPKEMLKLSKGEAAGSQAAQERIRSLEEEVAAREKTIREQTERVAKLEKTVKDMQALIDIKSKQGADLQKPAVAPPQTDGEAPMPAKPAHAGAGEARAAGAAAPRKQCRHNRRCRRSTHRPGRRPARRWPSRVPQRRRRPKPSPNLRASRKRPLPAPAPAPQSLVDQILNEPLYLGAGAVVIALLGFLGFRMIKKRREAGEDFDVEAEKKNSDVAPLTGTDTSGSMQAAARAAAAAQVTEEVDPLAEAEIYLAYGRDSQAEEILKEALAANPRRYEIHIKLLEIYAKRKDLPAFDPLARELQIGTGGQGELWLQAARLGYQLDPQNPRYLAGKPSGARAAVAAAAAAGGATGVAALDEKLDFNIGLEDADTGTKTDIDLTRLGGAGGGTTTDIDLSSLGGPDEAGGLEVDLSTISGVPERTVQVPDVDFDIEAPVADATASGGVDFDFDLNAISAPSPTSTQIMTKAMTQTVADVGEPGMGSIEFDLSKISLDVGEAGKMEPKLEFESSTGGVMPEIDLSSINLDLGGGQPEGGGEEPKDDRWYDVQTKFDLAKAYQEMGDKEGAREILREVIAEGDNDQKAAAERVLETLS